ncbi:MULTISPECIES: sensor histidine kinase [Burkholderia]|uniref:histidine kinase n=1 Tax=Burkholderia sola TaxID=2843302 RepID=A0ABV2CD58_9BURK|nr:MULTISPECIES: sensor histidine kinase KdpD [Burkholderia]KWU25479.1 sensor protein KdpD [Burkholderia cenocepacia]MBP0609063.1 sensor histidine kinase KdpD [Burkholderia sp. CpTa8-5]RQU94124.1 sensor histidine kinase KdpD [Burkholderia cenocepacia]CAG2282727.1 osmosensitive K+ channel signal transduction histidine kinase [Burkholderia cenocepacia]CAG2283134.1 osmosensitive K+ channel signal transduction histidine kinase [Burkholderia cenocepacia]
MNRPDPDQLLDKLQRDEEKQRRGQLKIFFGASAGVGKTYAMLQAARQRVQEGVDVVVGIVETHGRSETAALLDGLDVLPPARIDYRGRTLAEFDLDGALARAPQLILVDELAHSNVQGARHLKRWQDVYELLDAGIDVYTTVNVQHLESLNDVVGAITGIRVWETVPDRVFDAADEVTLVDLPAEELLERMRDGKVYLAQQAERAVRNFFRKGNLIALRELALRRTADRVDAQMREYRADRSIQRIWQARERLLVCVGPGAEAPTLVRAAARLAASLKADWIAVYVETPRLQRLPDARRQRTLDALKLAAELGAETVTLAGPDAVAALIGYAKVRNVSKLVAGGSPKVGLARRFARPFGEQLAERAGDVDLMLIRASASDETRAAPLDARARDWRDAFAQFGTHRSPPRHYAYAAAICAAITVVASVVSGRLDLTNLVMLYLLGVVFSAVRLGRGPGVLQSFLSVAAFDFFFVPPRMSFSVSDTQYLLTFFGMLLTSLVISHLTSTLTRQASVAQRRERRTGAIYAMARELGAALTTEQIVEIGSRHVGEVFRARVAFLLPDSADQVRQKIEEPDAVVTLTGAELDSDVGQWVYDQQKPAGRGTDTLPATAALYLPLKAPMRTRGVLAVASREPRELEVPEQQRMLDAFAAQIALALERVHYVEIARDALVNMESERLRNSLLSAISHDLRTPLTTIVGFSSMLANGRAAAQAGDAAAAGRLAQREGELVDAIHDEALRMTGIVTNLLDMARLQAGSLQLKRQWSLLEETVGAALAACRRVLARHPAHVALPADLPLLQMDAVLMERLFTNLFENAAKYTPPDTSLDIGAERVTDDGHPFVCVHVDDHGPGLPVGMETRIFDKFTRGEKESATPGIGLGLAICRAIVEAHGGKIGALNRTAPDGRVTGARFWFTLPVDTPPAAPAVPDDESDLPDASPPSESLPDHE